MRRLLAALLLAGVAPAAAAEPVDLEGTWHVLVHYRDANTAHPEQDRWNDRIWVFERKGSRLSWTEYPIVVFADDGVRFERRATGQYARVLGAWEPDAGQLQNIEEGLKINTRGQKKKSLRGSDEDGWRTVSRSRPGSASIITYQENWSVETPTQLPVFRQEDVMSSERSESLEGVTLYETTQVEANLLSGKYERDGTRRGTFRMRRSGSIGFLEEKTQEEMQRQAFRRGVATSQEARRMAREGLDAYLKAEGIELSEDQKNEVVSELIELFLDGKLQESSSVPAIRRLVTEKSAGSEAPAPE